MSKNIVCMFLIFTILAMSLAGCNSKNNTEQQVSQADQSQQSAESSEIDTTAEEEVEEEFDYSPQQRALAVLWQQESGEVKALRYQAYNSAKLYIDKLVSGGLKGDEAVVMDIDETVLDNIPHVSRLLYNNMNSSGDFWDEWVLAAMADEVEGAVEFIQYAQNNGVEVFLVSNRVEETLLDATEENLKSVNLDIPRENILLMTETSDKVPRFNTVKESHNIVMYVGDNLTDFPDDYYKKSNQDRSNVVVENKDNFGTLYVILPNPTYGDFESALVDYDKSLSSEELLQKRVDVLKPFKK